MSEEQKCHRCGEHEDIPTHQYVKFDQKIHYLCKGCWETFRSWMMTGNETLNGVDKKGRQV